MGLAVVAWLAVLWPAGCRDREQLPAEPGAACGERWSTADAPAPLATDGNCYTCLDALLCRSKPIQYIGMNENTVSALPFALNDANFLKRLRQAAADSSRVVVVQHAKQRMRERKINLNQVISCLQKGTVSEPAHLTHRGDWKATVTHRCAGDVIAVAVVLERKENGDYCIVVTVMR